MPRDNTDRSKSGKSNSAAAAIQQFNNPKTPSGKDETSDQASKKGAKGGTERLRITFPSWSAPIRARAGPRKTVRTHRNGRLHPRRVRIARTLVATG